SGQPASGRQPRIGEVNVDRRVPAHPRGTVADGFLRGFHLLFRLTAQLSGRDLGIRRALLHDDLRTTLVLEIGLSVAASPSQLRLCLSSLTTLDTQRLLCGTNSLLSSCLLLCEVIAECAVWPPVHREVGVAQLG